MTRSVLLCYLLTIMTNCGVNDDSLSEKAHIIPDILVYTVRPPW